MKLEDARKKAFKKLETDMCYNASDRSKEILCRFADLVIGYTAGCPVVQNVVEIITGEVAPNVNGKTRKRRRTKAEMEAARGE